MNWNNKENKKLIQAILVLETAQEAKSFLRDILTEKEITETAKRLQAAEMLLQDIPYSVIEKETGFSSTTVARVSKWLSTGEGGYKKILGKIHRHNSAQIKRGLS